MSCDSSAVRAFQDVWDRQFPDVPWVSQEILIPVKSDARVFSFVFLGIDEFPLVDLAWKSDLPASSVPRSVDVRQASQGMGFVLTLEGFDASWIHGFRLRQQGDRRFGGVACQQQTGEGTWQTIYHSKDRAGEFKEFMGGWFDLRRPEEQAELAGVVLMAIELAFGRTREATALIDGSGPLQAFVQENAWLPARFGLEYITHGLKRTFRFWGEEARKDSLREAVRVVEALRAVSEDACLFGGAALGLQREGRLLPHDDDVDILIVVDRDRCPDLGTALERIAAVLEKAGWPVVGHFFSHLWVQTNSSVAPTLDVFVGIAEGDRISYYPLPRRGLDRSRMFPRAWRQLEGVEIPVPRDLVYYLESEYGPQWQVPDAGFKLRWDRRPYADLAGNRSFPTLCTRGEKAFVAQQAAQAEQAEQAAQPQQAPEACLA